LGDFELSSGRSDGAKSIGLMVPIKHFYEEIVFDEPQLANQVVENGDVI
jgi:hypothetical protein